MRSLLWAAPGWLLCLSLSACHARAYAPGVGRTVPCPLTASRQAELTATLLHGDAPDASPAGQCVAVAARRGEVPAAMLLADVYGRAIAAVGGNPAPGPALQLDLFGRHIDWLHIAAEGGYAPAQAQLARETDGVLYRPMPNEALAWYQIAAANGDRSALAAIGAAYARGRIRDERLYAFKIWLTDHAGTRTDARQLLELLDAPAVTRASRHEAPIL